MASHTNTDCQRVTEERSILDRLVMRARRLTTSSMCRRERWLIQLVLDKEAELLRKEADLAVAPPAPAHSDATTTDEPPVELVMALREPKGKPRYVALVVAGVPVSVVVNPRGECDRERELAAWQWLEERIRRDVA